MIGVDSSILVRYVTRDDEEQTRLATTFLEDRLSDDDPGHVTVGALLETIWVLRRVYGYTSAQVGAVVSAFLGARQLRLAERTAIERALRVGASGLAAAIIHELGRQAGCSETVTFDRRFARLAGVTLLSG